MSDFRNMDPKKGYLNCYIVEVKQWPKYGPNLAHYAVADIYRYNSLHDNFENKKQSPYIQIPQYFVRNFDESVLDNLKEIVEKNIPIIKKIDDEIWEFSKL